MLNLFGSQQGSVVEPVDTKEHLPLTIWKYRDSYGRRHWFLSEQEAEEHREECIRQVMKEDSDPEPYMLPGNVMKLVIKDEEALIQYLNYLRAGVEHIVVERGNV